MFQHLRTTAALTATIGAALGGSLLLPGAAHAVTPHATNLTFTNDSPTAVPNGFASVDAPDVTFRATAGPMQVADFGNQSDGQAIAAFGVVASLEIDLAKPTTGISLAFGNDDPGLSNTTFKAQLDLFRGAIKVGTADTRFNANDIMDQRVHYLGPRLFDRAVLTYVNGTGAVAPIAEIADDIKVAPQCTKAGNNKANVIVGTSHKDVLCGDGGNDVIQGAGAGDLVYGGAGNDQILAGDGADWVDAGDGRDVVHAGAGNDIVSGDAARDRLFGEAGSDVLLGGSSHDLCDGGSQHDTVQSCEVRVHIP